MRKIIIPKQRRNTRTGQPSQAVQPVLGPLVGEASTVCRCMKSMDNASRTNGVFIKSSCACQKNRVNLRFYPLRPVGALCKRAYRREIETREVSPPAVGALFKRAPTHLRGASRRGRSLLLPNHHHHLPRRLKNHLPATYRNTRRWQQILPAHSGHPNMPREIGSDTRRQAAALIPACGLMSHPRHGRRP